MKVDFYNHNLDKSYQKFFNNVLKTNFLTSGTVGKKVESILANFFSTKHSLLTNSWTNGALATLLAINIKPGDEVIIPAMTFIATANVIELLGAKPVFVDVDKNSFLIDFNKVSKAINKNTKAIIPVHLYGNMVDIKKLRNLIKIKTNKKIYIIEDSAHCFEGKFNNKLCGTFSDVAIFSFYATKNITCGEGGAIITNNKSLFEKIKEIRTHGMTNDAIRRFEKKNYVPWNMNRLGIKANLPDLLACLLPKQISEVFKNHKRRKKAFLFYDNLLKDLKLKTPASNDFCEKAYHLYIVLVNPNQRTNIIKYLNSNGIMCTINYTSVTDLNYYKKKYKIKTKNFNISNTLGKSVISLPFHTNIKRSDQEYVATILKQAIKKYE
jgi:UDP-4-amino-4-deoxy-L-arabinose-oxoglutarate aminotransferase